MNIAFSRDVPLHGCFLGAVQHSFR
jgi:hypothetical protein